MLINLMDSNNDSEYVKSKKNQRFPPPNISLYHLDEVISTGNFINIVGYIMNNNHSNPTLENGYIVPIT